VMAVGVNDCAPLTSVAKGTAYMRGILVNESELKWTFFNSEYRSLPMR
jgi:hypothetical protein